MHVPHIVVDTSPAFYKGPYVINNEFSMGELAGAHLIEQGCKRIAFFNASKEMSTFSSFSQQLAGLKSTVGKSGITIHSKDIIYAGISIEDGMAAFKRLHERGLSYDGILCVNDEVAYGVMQEAEHLGLRVGKDIAIIGIDDLKTSSLDRISLTSIHMNYELMTTLAVNTLINGIESGREITSRIVLEPELIIRSSSGLIVPS
jgi:DNA-binding LacI/PurR family transcriptional regulator